jgi:hypothetical protein
MKKLLSTLSIIFLAFQVFAQVNLTNGLMAYYPFNGNANDASGNGLNGSVVGASLTTDRFGNSNGAYYFDGNSSYIKSIIPMTISGTTNKTMSVWFNWQNSGSGTDIHCLFGWGTLSNFGNYNYLKVQRTSNALIYHEHAASATLYSDNNTVNYSQWYNYTFVFENGIGNIYLNGKLLKSTAVNSNIVSTPIYIGYDKQVELSGRGNSSWTTSFNGIIDDIRIYKRALTTSEISALYCENLPTPQITITGFGLSTTTIGGYTSQWYKYNVSISGANTNLLSFPLSNGTYQVGYNGCSLSQGLTFPVTSTPVTVTSVITVTSPPVTVTGNCPLITVQGVSLLTEVQSIYPNATIYMYPNPTSGNLTVIATNVTVSSIEVYNSLGVLVQTQSGSSINISSQPAGIYNIWLKDSQNRYLAGQKISKQ